MLFIQLTHEMELGTLVFQFMSSYLSNFFFHKLIFMKFSLCQFFFHLVIIFYGVNRNFLMRQMICIIFYKEVHINGN